MDAATLYIFSASCVVIWGLVRLLVNQRGYQAHHRRKEAADIPRAHDLWVQSERKALQAWEDWFRQELGPVVYPKSLEDEIENAERELEFRKGHMSISGPFVEAYLTSNDFRTREIGFQLQMLRDKKAKIERQHYYL